MLQTEEQFTPENKKLMVLVVDDELINREILGQILSEEYHVIFAEDGKKGLAAIRDHRSAQIRSSQPAAGRQRFYSQTVPVAGNYHGPGKAHH